MPQRVRIVTDSTADLPLDVRETLQITVVPLNVHFGEEVLKDGEEIWADEFYHRLENGGILANTSQPSPSEFVKVYENLARDGEHIVSIHISEKMSGTLSSAHLAADMIKDRIPVTVVDSKVVSMGLGLVVMAGARAAAKGESLETVMAEIERAKQEIQLNFTVDTLAYLNRTGRIGKASALLGSLLNIRPILSIEDGLIVPVEKFRGNSAKANQRLLELTGLALQGRECIVAVVHANAPEEARRLVGLLPGYIKAREVFTSTIGPIVGAHAGPGTIGIMGMPVR